MLRPEILELLKVLELDIPDWQRIPHDVQTRICEWILEDRIHPHTQRAEVMIAQRVMAKTHKKRRKMIMARINDKK